MKGFPLKSFFKKCVFRFLLLPFTSFLLLEKYTQEDTDSWFYKGKKMKRQSLKEINAKQNNCTFLEFIFFPKKSLFNLYGPVL